MNNIAYVLICITIIWITYLILTTNTREGLQNSRERKSVEINILEENLKKLSEEKQKNISIDNYKSKYEDYIIDLEDIINNKALSEIISLDVSDKNLYAKMDNINKMYLFINNLNKTMKYVEK